MTPTVSVIVPCHNQGIFLPKALESILAQDYTDWEVIVVNDGSTDNTPVVVAQFGDVRIRYICQENQGVSAARNAGIRIAQGTYLAFLDADDEWEPAFLQRCVDVLRSDERLGGVYTRSSFVDIDEVLLPQIGGQVVPRGAFRERNLEGGFFPVHAALVRADVIHTVGVFDTALTSEEDWDLWIRLSEHYEMQGIPEALARYRMYPGSMSTNAARMHANRVAVLTKSFGPLDGDPAEWSEEKRRVYGCAYRSTATQYVQQGQTDEGWDFLAQAVSLWPRLLERLDTFYELACGDQPSGYRGQAYLLDISGNGTEILKRLDALFAAAGPELEPLRRHAYGQACLALAMLSDQAGSWRLACRYLIRAVKTSPDLLYSTAVVRRLLKLCVGQWMVRPEWFQLRITRPMRESFRGERR